MSRNLAFVVAILALLSGAGYPEEIDTLPWNVPLDLESAIKKPSFLGLKPANWINPFYLRGDFDGDGKTDYALLVSSTRDGRKGIAIWLSSRRAAPIIFGVGHSAKVGAVMSNDWGFFDAWQVYGKRLVTRGVGEGPPPRLIGEAILIERTEAASGLLYWTGRAFRWYQQSD